MKMSQKNQDQKFMRAALALAEKGRGFVAPNPMVGCVIVRSGKIISQGYHKKYGGAHAEIEALRKIQHISSLSSRGRGSLSTAKGGEGEMTMYVTLEPCFHYGKTPPCVDAVMASGVERVVIAMLDPNPLTQGKSVKKLRAAGISTAVGVCEREAKVLNQFFIQFLKKKMPYVICKVAQSLDGMITTEKGRQGWITGQAAQKYVHELRSQVDAILVGRGTLAIDDPQLNVRIKKKNVRQPARVILDPDLQSAANDRPPQIFKVCGGPVYFMTALPESAWQVRRIKKWGGHIVYLPLVGKSRWSVRQILNGMTGLGFSSVMVEGGAQVFHDFAKSRRVDEWHLLIAPKIVGNLGLRGLPTGFKPHLPVHLVSKRGRDYLFVFRKSP